MEERRLVDRLDPKATGDLSLRLRKNVEATEKQRPVGFDPREVLAIGDKHRQMQDPVRGNVVYLRVMVLEEISNKPVDGHPKSVVKEVNEDYDLARIRGTDVLAKSTPVTQMLLRHQKSTNHKAFDVLLRPR